MSDIVWILLIVLILYIFQQLLISRESFCGFGRDGKNCDKVSSANETCKQLAEQNCRIPTWMMNDCWLNEYQRCKTSDKCGLSSNCNCYDMATQKCASSNCPADACFHDLHQKCMAGLGLAPDPDRGVPFPM